MTSIFYIIKIVFQFFKIYNWFFKLQIFQPPPMSSFIHSFSIPIYPITGVSDYGLSSFSIYLYPVLLSVFLLCLFQVCLYISLLSGHATVALVCHVVFYPYFLFLYSGSVLVVCCLTFSLHVHTILTVMIPVYSLTLLLQLSF